MLDRELVSFESGTSSERFPSKLVRMTREERARRLLVGLTVVEDGTRVDASAILGPDEL